MSLPFYVGREQELHDLIETIDHATLNQAACLDVDPKAYHPTTGTPDREVLRRCYGCPARLACLGLALRAEEPDQRHGWYGGLSPTERAAVAVHIGLEPATASPSPEPAVEATRLREAGWRVDDIADELGCCRRTVQRYLRAAA